MTLVFTLRRFSTSPAVVLHASSTSLQVSLFREVYDELEVRAAIIERMVELGVMEFYDVYSVISTLHGMPIEEAYWGVDEICRAVLGKH